MSTTWMSRAKPCRGPSPSPPPRRARDTCWLWAHQHQIWKVVGHRSPSLPPPPPLLAHPATFFLQSRRRAVRASSRSNLSKQCNKLIDHGCHVRLVPITDCGRWPQTRTLFPSSTTATTTSTTSHPGAAQHRRTVGRQRRSASLIRAYTASAPSRPPFAHRARHHPPKPPRHGLQSSLGNVAYTNQAGPCRPKSRYTKRAR